MVFSKVIIEARNGSQYDGDIAIDDIDLKDGSCPSAGKSFMLSEISISVGLLSTLRSHYK